MRRVFDFGKVAYTGSRVENRITVSIELKEKDGRPVFSASGEIWNRSNSDIICGGQCLDEIAKTPIGSNATFQEIYRLWKLYHLNDMHPECEHQEALGWKEQAREGITIRDFWLNSETTARRNMIERAIIDAAKKGDTYTTTPEERTILNLDSHIETTEETLPEDKASFYKLYKEKHETRGWVSFEKSPLGILCKPCPVCGYKYGTGWKYRNIPENDLQIIKNLMEG